MVRIGKELKMEFKDVYQQLVLNLIFTSNWLKHMDAERLRPYGISPQQYNILRILRGAKGEKMCMFEVLDRMLDRSPNATRLTDKLIAKELVIRERSEQDRRVVQLLISEKGLELLRSIDQGDDLLQVVRKLSETEAEEMNRTLDKMRS